MDNNIYLESFFKGLVLMVLVILLLAPAVLLIICDWKILSKAGKPGWAAIIPFYNIYILSDVVFGNAKYFVVFIVNMALSFITKSAEISALIILINLFMIIYWSIKLSKAFGKGGGFIVGMILLPYIFYPILAFGRAEYIGPEKKIPD